MKRSILVILLGVLVGGMLVHSCSKTSNYTTGTPVTPQLPISMVFAALRSAPQLLSVTAGRDTVVYGAQGTMLHFYTRSFRNAAGATLTSGTVNIQLIEMYRAGDMIANNATTLASGQILMSGGEIKINATLNGQTVYANNYGVGFIHSSGSGTNMALFSGGNANADSTATWTIADTSRNGTRAAGTVTDTTLFSHSPFFVFDSCTNFIMVNCDCYRNDDSPKTSIAVIMPDSTYTPNNTQIFVVMHNVNPWGSYSDTSTAVLASDNQWGQNGYIAASNMIKLINEGSTTIIPAGQKYEMIVMTLKNNTWYYYQESGTVPHNGVLSRATMIQTTETGLKAVLSAL